MLSFGKIFDHNIIQNNLGFISEFGVQIGPNQNVQFIWDLNRFFSLSYYTQPLFSGQKVMFLCNFFVILALFLCIGHFFNINYEFNYFKSLLTILNI